MGEGEVNPLFLTTTAGELSKIHKARHPLSSNQLDDIRSFLDGTANPPTMTKVSGKRVLVPVTNKALFEGTLDPPSSPTTEEEQFVVHIGDGKFREKSRSDARRLFNKQADKSSIGTSASQQSSTTAHSLGQEIREIQTNELKRVADIKSTKSQKSPSDEGLPLIEIREEWDESNAEGPVRSEIVNISKQMERLNAGLKKAENRDDEKRFGGLLADLLRSGDADIQTADIQDAVADDSNESKEAILYEVQTENPPRSAKISDKEYKSIYSRLEELEKLEEASINEKIIDRTKNSTEKNSNSAGWTKGFLNAKPKKKTTTKEQSTKSNPNVKLANDVKLPMKQPITKEIEADSKSTKVSFSKEVNVKEISPRAAAQTPHGEPNYFNVPSEEINPFPPIETVPFEENVFKGVVKERVASSSIQKDKCQGTEKKLSRFALQRLERGL